MKIRYDLVDDNDDNDDDDNDESMSASIEWAAWGTSCILPANPPILHNFTLTHIFVYCIWPNLHTGDMLCHS